MGFFLGFLNYRTTKTQKQVKKKKKSAPETENASLQVLQKNKNAVWIKHFPITQVKIMPQNAKHQ